MRKSMASESRRDVEKSRIHFQDTQIKLIKKKELGHSTLGRVMVAIFFVSSFIEFCCHRLTTFVFFLPVYFAFVYIFIEQ